MTDAARQKAQMVPGSVVAPDLQGAIGVFDSGVGGLSVLRAIRQALPHETLIYVADSESDDVQNPGWEEGIRIGDAKSGWVQYFIQFPWGDPRDTAGIGAEFVAVDRDGNIYGGEPSPKPMTPVSLVIRTIIDGRCSMRPKLVSKGFRSGI